MSSQLVFAASALVGGGLIGLAATLLWVGQGQRAGVSSILAGLGRSKPGEGSWRWLFLLGLLAGGLVAQLIHPASLGGGARALGPVLVGAFLAGLGSRVGGGCTSGHGVVGISSGSVRSLVATAVFIVAGMATVLVAGRGAW